MAQHLHHEEAVQHIRSPVYRNVASSPERTQSDVTMWPWEIHQDDVSLGSVLGKGEFGVVHTGCWLSTPVAIKVRNTLDKPCHCICCSALPSHRSRVVLSEF